MSHQSHTISPRHAMSLIQWFVLPSADAHTHTNQGIVVGSVIGGLLLIALIVLFVRKFGSRPPTGTTSAADANATGTARLQETSNDFDATPL
jgi:hypothetical protein